MSLSPTTKSLAKPVAVPVAPAGAIAASVRRTRSRLVYNAERVRIDAPPEAVWTYISDFENHWEPSNPDHAGTHVPSAPKMPLRDGLRFVQHERVGGFMGTLDATLRDVMPEQTFSWRTGAVYRYAGLELTVPEGGTMTLTPASGGTRLAHWI